MASGLQLTVAVLLRASESSAWDPRGTSPSIIPAAAAGRALRGDVGTRGDKRGVWAWGSAEPARPADPKPGGRRPRPLDKCSSQPSLIAGEISGVPAQHDAELPRRRGITPAEAEHNAAAPEGQPLPRGQGKGLLGSPWPFSPLPLLGCSSPALLFPPSTPLNALFSLSAVRPAAVGCAVGPWGPWSGCSSLCGVGSRARSRQVTVPPRHGGEPCPDLKQRRGCLGEHPTCGTATGNAGPAETPTQFLRGRPRAVFNQPCPPPWLLFCQKWPRYCRTPSGGTSGIPGREPGCCRRRSPRGRCGAGALHSPLPLWPLCNPQTQGLSAPSSHRPSPHPAPNHGPFPPHPRPVASSHPRGAHTLLTPPAPWLLCNPLQN